jgi:hypothetical protein
MLCYIQPVIRLAGPTERLYLNDNLHLAPLFVEWYRKVCEIYNLSIHFVGIRNNRFYVEYHASDDVLKMLYGNLLSDPDYKGKIPIMLGDVEYLVDGKYFRRHRP